MPANSSNCQELNLPISVAEVELAIARLNLNKAPGNPTPQILETQLTTVVLHSRVLSSKSSVKFSMLDSLTGQRQTAFYWMNKMVLGLTVSVWTIFLLFAISSALEN